MTFLCLSLLTQPSVANDIMVAAGGSIQSAIDSASDGDVICVAPGSYFENIDFLGKSITVTSTDGPGTTIIDGGGNGPVAQFSNNESRDATLSGFTLQNGVGGIVIGNSSPTITGNTISGNSTSSGGGGIAVGGGEALIQDNTIVNNSASAGHGIQLSSTDATVLNNIIQFNTRSPGSGGVGGGGISVVGAGNARIFGNLIDSNTTSSDGGGISLFAAGNPVIIGNTISNNSGNSGGGISHANVSDSVIAQNLIVGNNASSDGGGVEWLTSSSSTGPRLINNTIALNSTNGEGSAIFADGFDEDVLLANNILFGTGDENVVGIGDFNDLNDPIFLNNIIYSTTSQAIGSANAPIIGINGNLEVNPLFVDSLNGDFQVTSLSAAIDGGLNEFLEELTEFGFGNLQIFDGDGDGIATVDIGAFETVPEPSSIMLLLPALAVLMIRRRRQS